MKKILLVDYYGICDGVGNPIGHSSKVLREYAQLLQGAFSLSAALSPCLAAQAEGLFDEVIPLKYDILANGKKSIAERIMDKWKLLCNIRQVGRLKGYDLIWFYRTDFFLFLFSLFGVPGRKGRREKRVAQVYQEEFVGGKLDRLLTAIYQKGALRFDGLIYTQRGMGGFHPRSLHLPDYYYNKEKYANYYNIKKEDKTICLGTMNPYKKLEEAVEAFGKNGMRLEIRGYFYDKERLERLLARKRENILIQDQVLSEEEYYSLLAGAKYSLLPYDMSQYSSRTSGVLLESLFLGAIPVAPKKLLAENGIDGVGYESLSELSELQWTRQPPPAQGRDALADYDREAVRGRLLCFLCGFQ